MYLHDVIDWFSILVMFLILALLIGFWVVGYRKGQENPLESSVGLHRLFLRADLPPCYVQTKEIGYREITAYNPVEEQTDDTPCFTASGLEICETKRSIVASNEFAFGTLLKIDGKIYEVQDRINAKYKNRIDLLMYDYQEALDWGKRTLIIELAF